MSPDLKNRAAGVAPSQDFPAVSDEMIVETIRPRRRSLSLDGVALLVRGDNCPTPSLS